MPHPAATLVISLLVQQPNAPRPPAVTVLDAALGGNCSSGFTVKDAEGKPVFASTIHVRVRYGFAGVKRADLEVGTSSDGKARIDGLPSRARTLTYDIQKDGKKIVTEQNVAFACNAEFEVTLK